VHQGSKLKPEAKEFVPHVQFESPVARRKTEFQSPTKSSKEEKKGKKGGSIRGGKKGKSADGSSLSEMMLLC